jgi:uncharacterized membrane protein YdjX (TVP38/TMEM64 family)
VIDDMGKVVFGVLVIIAMIMIMAIGAGVPIAAIYFMVNYGFDTVAGTLISITAVVVGGGLAFFLIIFVFEEKGGKLISGIDESERERLNILRAETRAMLEEFDEMIGILSEIKDILKEVGD